MQVTAWGRASSSPPPNRAARAAGRGFYCAQCLPTLLKAPSFLPRVAALGQQHPWLHESPRRDWAQGDAALGALGVSLPTNPAAASGGRGRCPEACRTPSPKVTEQGLVLIHT